MPQEDKEKKQLQNVLGDLEEVLKKSLLLQDKLIAAYKKEMQLEDEMIADLKKIIQKNGKI